ncbi:MAG: hypothetical protein FWC60_03160 [Firmicutes bacterium]|nr:hypothetical protein [Bacillota bacterium]
MSARLARSSRFEVRNFAVFVDPLAQVRKAVNRKRPLEEHEHTANGFACRLMLNSHFKVAKETLKFL